MLRFYHFAEKSVVNIISIFPHFWSDCESDIAVHPCLIAVYDSSKIWPVRYSVVQDLYWDDVCKITFVHFHTFELNRKWKKNNIPWTTDVLQVLTCSSENTRYGSSLFKYVPSLTAFLSKSFKSIKKDENVMFSGGYIFGDFIIRLPFYPGLYIGRTTRLLVNMF